jgi:predicted metal-binding membrane protein
MSHAWTFPPTVPPEVQPPATPKRPLLDRLIARDGAVVAVCLLALIALAWVWLAAAPPGGHEMHGGHAGMTMAAEPLSAAYLLPAFAMWALMMVAMMLPSAAPMILLYSRVAARSGGKEARLAPTSLFLLTYLAVWTLFAAAAALAQALLIAAGPLGAMTLALGDSRIAGLLLLLAGLYQLSPLKRACLDQCRSPLSFILRLSRPGLAGALRLGVAHGLYCLGCCWALMLLLFVGGVMDLAWIAALSLLVLIEKYAPSSLPVRPALAAALILGGAILLAAPRYWQ